MYLKSTEKENIEYAFEFQPKLTLLEYETIVSCWDEKISTKYNWWKEFSLFAGHVLKECLDADYKENFEEIFNEVNYDIFIPVLEKYFLTEHEYEVIVKNIGYMKRDAQSLFKETPVFKIYQMMRMWGIKPTLDDFLKMEYKVFMKFYLYSLGENFIVPLGKPKEEPYVR